MRYLIYFLTFLLTSLIVWMNIAMYHPTDKESTQQDIIAQLNGLEQKIKKDGIAHDMQILFPEGYEFTYALYGISWCELALSDPKNSLDIKDKAIAEALYAYDQIDSETGKSTFDKNLSPEYGIFYLGWKNYLLSKVFSISRIFPGATKYLGAYKANCDQIAAALQSRSTPFLESYASGSWPPDMFPAVASLANWDRSFQTIYDSLIQDWVSELPSYEDQDLQLLPFRVDPSNGSALEPARGSSNAIICKYLLEIDTTLAHSYFKRFQEIFETRRMGLPAILEYPEGTQGDADIDSGPVIWGVGFSATISSIVCYGSFGDKQMADELFQTIHGFGFRTSLGTGPEYLLGQMPIADLFMLWGRACSISHQSQSGNPPNNYRMTFHGISAAVLIPLWILSIWLFIRKRKK